MVSQKKILIVEDNNINRTMLREILSGEYQVLEAENGLEALEVLRTHGESVSLILLDIVMPVMDGYTFLSRIKGDPAYSSIPVIVTTQSDGESDEVAALSHGAADFVAKPYRPQIILHRVASIINLRETAAMINLMQYDRLTGLYSKEFFYQRVKNILAQQPEQKFDIVCSDIENFKLVNDIFGIAAGDHLLRCIAQMYTQFVGERGICGRFNADQFACLLPHNAQYTDAFFIQTNAKLNAISQAENVVLKWGVYAIEDRSIPVEQMCDRALLAARSIKGQYGKYFATYDDALRSKLLREQIITDGMVAALEQGQFEIYLQPKYQIKDDTLAGAEALVRWNHPEWGVQSPGEFIPLFEKNGFITKLDQFVWDRTCAVLQEWDEKGYPPLPVSVNVSRADIYNSDLADTLMKTVQKYGLAPSRLHLEITESAYTENPNQIVNTVSHLRELGFVIEMDDFGSGYSSLNMLNQMPLDILKLDMKFIQSETAKPVSQGILRFIMDLARWMCLDVVAEGVETKEQLERLREIGCDFVQGYYFARPMPCGQFESLMQTQRSSSVYPHASPRPPQPPRILLVADEDPAYRAQVEATFSNSYQIVHAPDCPAALACISSEAPRIAAVLLSLTLPQGGGFTVLQSLQHEKSNWAIPVIATAPANQQLEAQALELGADDFAGKPHLQQSLHKRLLHVMSITAWQQREALLQDEANRDYLTGLLNRRGLAAAAETLLGQDGPVAVFLFDLEQLGQVNQDLGHIQGDQLLVQFSLLLRAHTRSDDILSRFGGDEFVVVMKRISSPEHALKKGEEICRAVRDIRLAGQTEVSCSGGIVIDSAARPIAGMIKRADQALHRAKADCKGTCALSRQ